MLPNTTANVAYQPSAINSYTNGVPQAQNNGNSYQAYNGGGQPGGQNNLAVSP